MLRGATRPVNVEGTRGDQDANDENDTAAGDLPFNLGPDLFCLEAGLYKFRRAIITTRRGGSRWRGWGKWRSRFGRGGWRGKRRGRQARRRWWWEHLVEVEVVYLPILTFAAVLGPFHPALAALGVDAIDKEGAVGCALALLRALSGRLGPGETAREGWRQLTQLRVVAVVTLCTCLDPSEPEALLVINNRRLVQLVLIIFWAAVAAVDVVVGHPIIIKRQWRRRWR
mmetsp:Transcript_45643/g.102872  ORF Transcript_45643/g.102872 Transcript_45643/m.102872 type:complete len:227 (+) Transcript_45643:168-848(+)